MRRVRRLLLAVLAMGVALATGSSVAAIAGQPTPQTMDYEDRRPLNLLLDEEVQRSRAVVELFRSGERNFVPDPGIIDVATPAQASLLLGLVGGMVGGCAALAGWTAATVEWPGCREPDLPAAPPLALGTAGPGLRSRGRVDA